MQTSKSAKMFNAAVAATVDGQKNGRDDEKQKLQTHSYCCLDYSQVTETDQKPLKHSKFIEHVLSLSFGKYLKKFLKSDITVNLLVSRGCCVWCIIVHEDVKLYMVTVNKSWMIFVYLFGLLYLLSHH